MAAASAAARAAGSVVALGALIGLAPADVVVVVGALGAVTAGRCMRLESPAAARAAAAVAVGGAALGVAALRWGEPELGALRGVQAVLGPTLTVGPAPAATATALAAGAAVVAFALWLTPPGAARRVAWLALAAEGIVAALACVALFWGPALPPRDSDDFAGALATWVGATALVALALVLFALAARRLRPRWTWALLALAASAAVAGAAVAATTA